MMLALTPMVFALSALLAADGQTDPRAAPVAVPDAPESVAVPEVSEELSPPLPAATPRPRPTTATAALDQAAAAYEYGDLNLVVESARLIMDGAVKANEAERADALRFLGIGLYITGRIEGARLAFEELLRLRPDAFLDPTLTRPEVVTFFSQLKRGRQEEAHQQYLTNRPGPAWVLLPPMGQFKNGDDMRGWIILGAEVLFLGAAIATSATAYSWQNPDHTYGYCPPGGGTCSRNDDARTMRTLNHWSVGLLAATYIAGVIDAGLRRSQIYREDTGPLGATREPAVSVSLLPLGGTLKVRF